jgi:uncharacterized protein YjiS (DUF1127 family)
MGALPVALMGPSRRRTETRHIALLTAIRRIVAAIRLWRGRARSRRQLRELGDYRPPARRAWLRSREAVLALGLSDHPRNPSVQ